MSGSSSRRPVVTSSRRAEIRCPSASSDPEPGAAVGTQLGDRARRRSRRRSPSPRRGRRASSSAGGSPSRDRKPCMWAAGALRGAPASTTRTRRRARDRTSAADSPAAPPPMTATSYSLMSPQAGARQLPCDNDRCCFRETGVDGPWTPRSDDATSQPSPTALDQVGPRLQAAAHPARHDPDRRRGGDRDLQEHPVPARDRAAAPDPGAAARRSSQTYRVPLDDLVGAPEVGDPRIRLKPGRVNGRTVIPLTRQPDGMQAWKIVIPA